MSDIKKIVMIDDEEALCTIVKENLEDSGKFDVQTLSDSTQAVDFIRVQNPDVILLDIVMPQLGGPELIEAIKKDPGLKSIPIIVLSGKGEMVYNKKKDDFKWMPNSKLVQGRGDLPDLKGVEALAEAYGVADYISKPFATEILISVVEEVLEKYKKAPPNDDVI